MKDTRLFIPYWIISSVLLFFAPLFLGNLVVVGNARLSGLLSAIISGFILALAHALLLPALRSIHVQLKSDWEMIVTGASVNVLGIWFIARYADLTGFGVASFLLAAGLGILLYGLEWFIGNQFLALKKK